MINIIEIYNEEFECKEYKLKEIGELSQDDCPVATCKTYKEAFQIMDSLKSESGDTYALVLDNTKESTYFVCPLGQAYKCEKNFSGYEIIHTGTYSEMCQIKDEWDKENIIPFGL